MPPVGVAEFGSAGVPAVPFEPGMVAVPGAVYAPDVVCARLAPAVPPLSVAPMLDAPLLDELMPEDDEFIRGVE